MFGVQPHPAGGVLRRSAEQCCEARRQPRGSIPVTVAHASRFNDALGRPAAASRGMDNGRGASHEWPAHQGPAGPHLRQNRLSHAHPALPMGVRTPARYSADLSMASCRGPNRLRGRKALPQARALTSPQGLAHRLRACRWTGKHLSQLKRPPVVPPCRKRPAGAVQAGCVARLLARNASR